MESGLEDLVEFSAEKEDNVVDSEETREPDIVEYDGKSTYSYERLKSNSTYPVRGIDYKRREVCHQDCFSMNPGRRVIKISAFFFSILYTLIQCSASTGLPIGSRVPDRVRYDPRTLLSATQVEAGRPEKKEGSVLIM